MRKLNMTEHKTDGLLFTFCGLDGCGKTTMISQLLEKEDYDKIVELLNVLHEENQLLKEEKELLKNKLDRIEDILPHFLSCAEISEFHGKTVKEDIALMKCWNKRYQK